MFFRLFIAFACMVVLTGPAASQGVQLDTGTHSNDATYRIFIPDEQSWNGDLILFCHGYVFPQAQNTDHLTRYFDLPEIINGLGFAVAASTFSTKGVAAEEGVADTIDLLRIFEDRHGSPRNVFVAGISQGALIATLIAEKHPDLVDGVISISGPIGDWPMQLNYVGDFRVLFDIFFPGHIDGSPVDVPLSVEDNWGSIWPGIREDLEDPRNRWKLRSLMAYARGPFDIADVTGSSISTIETILDFQVLGVRDAIAKHGGIPFENTRTTYRGGFAPLLVNQMAYRQAADPDALATIEEGFQTTGHIQDPMVIVHNYGDPLIPYWHVPLYQLKLIRAGTNRNVTHLSSKGYGHVTGLNQVDVFGGFAVLIFKVTGELPDFAAFLKDDASVEAYYKTIEAHLK